MKKSERLNSMLRYLSDKKHFNLSDLMTQYSISKSTALRDIDSLEEIGLSFYSESGRYGKYVLLNNKVLPAIHFTDDELFILYLSLMTVKNYKSLPFNIEFSRIQQKFLDNVSTLSQNRLHELERIIRFENISQPYESHHLSDIIQSILANNVVTILYRSKSYTIQFYKVSSSFNQWYATGYDHLSKSIKVFRCDKIETLEVATHLTPINQDILKQKSSNHYSKQHEFKIEIAPNLVDVYYKENYPTIKLCTENDQVFLKGHYDDHEIRFITAYLSKFSEGILSIHPEQLRFDLILYLKKQLKQLEQL
ncbi:helix-turn-helix transcriptional regulator [Fusibacter ferrireducens]|uniref:WYL domain-containing protein n=1 Tax=Fusibacter ferrireducens TaxID=2785058 RepID=A0ABR9ZU28_9FIRM|nr:WYL domain-containing protein [Fusibacter ferrireducens]MBF4693079.1 WYL domain-containing protein [Fusibacter ferrireducens]